MSKRPNPYGSQNFGNANKRGKWEEEKKRESRMNPQEETDYTKHKSIIGLAILSLLKVKTFNPSQLRNPTYVLPEEFAPIFKMFQESRKEILKLNPDHAPQYMSKPFFYYLQIWEKMISHTKCAQRTIKLEDTIIKNNQDLNDYVNELENYFQNKEETDKLFEALIPFESLLDNAIQKFNAKLEKGKVKEDDLQHVLEMEIVKQREISEIIIEEGAEKEYEKAIEDLEKEL